MTTTTITPLASYRNELPYPFCPGCGHGLILNQLNAALVKLGLDPTLFSKSNAAIEKALEGHGSLTRQGLKGILADIGIMTDVQRLAHIIMQAELEGLICSGPMQGRQHTYVLVDERVRESRALTREQSLAELARRYFGSHGPAQLALLGLGESS